MSISRRAWISGLCALPLQAKIADALAAGAQAAPAAPRLPAKADFPALPLAYLDSGTMHPFSVGAVAALQNYLASRRLDPAAPAFSLDETEKRVIGRFAGLINATPEEICVVQSTTAGEHLVVRALDIPASRGRIITDTLHFPGSFYLYQELSKQGMDVAWLKPRDGQRIHLDDLEAALTKDTRLVALSLVSTVNGFQHDLAQVCERAHARGAYVYADIMHAAGCVPLDVKASGVDFAACASYKWLMGDFGLGFLYVRADLHDKLRRPLYGYHQLAQFQTHVLPHDPPGATIADYTLRNDATGRYATGTISSTGLVHLDYSLDYISRIGVSAIQAHRQPLLERARAELVRKGFQPITPQGSTAPLLSFSYKDARSLAPVLQRAGVKITLARNYFRICPSVFNDQDDIERLLAALS